VALSISLKDPVFTTIAAILVEVSPPAPAPIERALLRACTDAAHVECGSSTVGPDVTLEARVTWSSSTTVEVRVTAQDGTRPRSRDIVFRPTDGEMERWRAVGLIVASLVTSDEQQSSELVAPTPMKLPRRARNAVWIGIGALVGNGTSAGPPRYGGWLSAGYQIAGLPAFLSLGSSYARAGANDAGIEGQWATFSLGGGLRFESTALRLLVRPGLGVSFQRMAAQSERSFMSGSRWVPATQAALTVCWPSRSVVALSLGALGSFASGATGVREGGVAVASFPSLGYALTLGVEAGFSN